MKRVMAAITALSLLTLTGCGSMPEKKNEQTLADQAQQLMTTAQSSEETSASAETGTETTKSTTTTAQETVAVLTDSLKSTTTHAATTAVKAATTSAAHAAATAAAANSGGNTGNSGNSGGSDHSGNSGNAGSSKTTTRVADETTKVSTTAAKSTATKATTAATVPTENTEHVTDEPKEETAPDDGITKMVNNVMVVNSGTDHPRAIELFSGDYDTAARYAKALNSYKSALGEDVNVWCMVVPTSQAFYTPEDIKGQYGDQLAHYHTICDQLDGVTGIPVYEVLDAHKGEQTYSRTDYHWQPLAAYYAAEQFAAYAGVPYAPLDTYEEVVREGYLGAFYHVNEVDELGEYPEQFTYYKPANLGSVTCTYYNTAFNNGYESSLFFENNSTSSSYTVFVGTDECILETDTNVENDRVLVIFKDSYGNALVPFLTQSFSKIYLCDFRYFDCNAIDFIQEVGATDLLFAMSTVAVCTSWKVDAVENNMYK